MPSGFIQSNHTRLTSIIEENTSAEKTDCLDNSTSPIIQNALSDSDDGLDPFLRYVCTIQLHNKSVDLYSSNKPAVRQYSTLYIALLYRKTKQWTVCTDLLQCELKECAYYLSAQIICLRNRPIRETMSVVEVKIANTICYALHLLARKRYRSKNYNSLIHYIQKCNEILSIIYHFRTRCMNW